MHFESVCVLLLSFCNVSTAKVFRFDIPEGAIPYFLLTDIILSNRCVTKTAHLVTLCNLLQVFCFRFETLQNQKQQSWISLSIFVKQKFHGELQRTEWCISPPCSLILNYWCTQKKRRLKEWMRPTMWKNETTIPVYQRCGHILSPLLRFSEHQ